MTPTTTLRRAASGMRAAAEVASAGPWKRFGMAGVAGAEWEVVDERRVECDCGEAVALLGCATNADAAHIAGMDPPVALAVALLLDGAADLARIHEPMGDHGDLCPVCGPVGRALAVAVAWLGGEGE